MLIFSFYLRPNDSTVMIGLVSGGLAGVASSTGELSEINSSSCPFNTL